MLFTMESPSLKLLNLFLEEGKKKKHLFFLSCVFCQSLIIIDISLHKWYKLTDNHWSGRSSPLVIILALLVFLIPTVFINPSNAYDYLHRACMFLVISCPCALIISIPLGFFGGIGLASKNGILVKGGNYLEALTKTKKRLQ